MGQRDNGNYYFDAVRRRWLAVLAVAILFAGASPLVTLVRTDTSRSIVELSPTSGGKDIVASSALEINKGPTASTLHSVAAQQSSSVSILATASGTTLRIGVETPTTDAADEIAELVAGAFIESASATEVDQINLTVVAAESALVEAELQIERDTIALEALLAERARAQEVAAATEATEDDRSSELVADASARQAERELDGAADVRHELEVGHREALAELATITPAFTITAGPTFPESVLVDPWTLAYRAALVGAAMAGAAILAMAALFSDLRTRAAVEQAIEVPVLATVHLDRGRVHFDDSRAVASSWPLATAIVAAPKESTEAQQVAAILGRATKVLSGDGLVTVGSITSKYVSIPDVDQVLLAVTLGKTRRSVARKLQRLLTDDGQPLAGVLLVREGQELSHEALDADSDSAAAP
ncbi:MAG: hypothetical protein ACI8Y4_004280 [Candidatus Poriferisodalaceae bacterium]|jgi:hypothetical protein